MGEFFRDQRDILAVLEYAELECEHEAMCRGSDDVAFQATKRSGHAWRNATLDLLERPPIPLGQLVSDKTWLRQQRKNQKKREKELAQRLAEEVD